MSRIYFHSEIEEREVYGSERFYMGKIISDMGVIPLLPLCKSLTGGDPPILKYLPQDHYLITEVWKNHPDDFKRAFNVWFRTVNEEGLVVNGEKYTNWILGLNTAIIMGSAPIKLYAMIHGLCEWNGYIEGRNRGWVAVIIKNGLKTSMYRKDRGWESIIKMLENDNESPVVMSYSVCQMFPNASVGSFYGNGEDEDEEWYKLSMKERWEFSMAGIRKHYNWLEIRPGFWDDYYFGTGTNSFMVAEMIEEEINSNIEK